MCIVPLNKSVVFLLFVSCVVLSIQGLSHRNLYKWRKHKYDDDDDDDCDCDDVIKAFENFFDCCVEEAHKRRLGSGSSTSSKSKSSSKSSKKPKHCGYDKDFSDDVNEAIKCCEFDDLVDAL